VGLEAGHRPRAKNPDLPVISLRKCQTERPIRLPASAHAPLSHLCTKKAIQTRHHAVSDLAEFSFTSSRGRPSSKPPRVAIRELVSSQGAPHHSHALGLRFGALNRRGQELWRARPLSNGALPWKLAGGWFFFSLSLASNLSRRSMIQRFTDADTLSGGTFV